MLMMSGGWAAGGADTRRDFPGNCLDGDRGDDAGDEREEARGRRSRAGDTAAGCRPPPPTMASSSSGSGPRVEPPEAEDTPDMADTEFRSEAAATTSGLAAAALLRPEAEATSEFWMAA